MQTVLLGVPADRWIDPATSLTVGGVRFDLQPVGPSHTPEDLVVYLPGQRILFAADLVFRSRIPFIGQADCGYCRNNKQEKKKSAKREPLPVRAL